MKEWMMPEGMNEGMIVSVEAESQLTNEGWI